MYRVDLVITMDFLPFKGIKVGSLVIPYYFTANSKLYTKILTIADLLLTN